MCLYSQEVEELKTELEVYEKRLESKYKAIAILRKQVGYVMIRRILLKWNVYERERESNIILENLKKPNYACILIYVHVLISVP